LTNLSEKLFKGFNRYRSYKKIRKDGFGEFQIVPYTRRLSIKYYCLECVGFSHSKVQQCTETKCSLYPYRLGERPENKTPNHRVKAIREFCLECCSDDAEYVNECLENSTEKLCPLHPYRLSGYKTDQSSLIPAKDIKTLASDERQFEYFKEKIAV